MVEDLMPLAFAPAFAAIAASAAARDGHGETLEVEIGILADCGALAGAMPNATIPTWSDNPLAVAAVLHALGRASLPVGRLFEGHVNAAQLIALYGEPSLRQRVADTVRQGGLLGVWGADGKRPVTAERLADGFKLSGGKSFCSGLSIVQTAIVSANFEGGTQLFAVDVTSEDRADAARWRVSGMRATASGDYDFAGLMLPEDAAMGGVGDYFIEPWFLGGMYRMCAVQAGGIDALLAALVAEIQLRRQNADTIQQFRIGQIAVEAMTARAVTDRVASMIANDTDSIAIAQHAAMARDAVETCATRALTMAERSGGTAAHREGSDLDRIRRDLGLYLRQAAIDSRLIQIGASLLATGAQTG